LNDEKLLVTGEKDDLNAPEKEAGVIFNKI
jgi:hypothetical protein